MNMAKFCGNCGGKLEENATQCPWCGTPTESQATPSSQKKQVDPERKKKWERIIKLAITAVVVIVIAAIALSIVPKYIGTQGLVRQVMNSYKNYDIEKLVSLSSGMYDYDSDEELETAYRYDIGEGLDYLEANVGHTYKFSYKINETYTLSQRKEEEVIENIETWYPDFDTSTIKKIVVSNVTMTATQGTSTASQDINVVMSKEDGTWKVLYLQEGDNVSTSSYD